MSSSSMPKLKSGMHDASQCEQGHPVQELARHGGTVLLYYPVCYLALEGAHGLGIDGALQELAVNNYHKGIVLAILAFADIAVVAEIGLEGQVQAPRQDEAEDLLSRPVGLAVRVRPRAPAARRYRTS